MNMQLMLYQIDYWQAFCFRIQNGSGNREGNAGATGKFCFF